MDEVHDIRKRREHDEVHDISSKYQMLYDRREGDIHVDKNKTFW